MGNFPMREKEKEMKQPALRQVKRVKNVPQTRGYSAAVDQYSRERRMSEGTRPRKTLRVSLPSGKSSEAYETVPVARVTEKALGVGYREGNRSARTHPYTQGLGG